MELTFPRSINEEFSLEKMLLALDEIDLELKSDIDSKQKDKMLEAVVCLGIYIGYLRRNGEVKDVNKMQEFDRKYGFLFHFLNQNKSPDYNPYQDSEAVIKLKKERDEYLS